jgi:hypothetical protein
MRASEFITERKKRKGKKPKYAAYGPGPYGWYGYNAGYSGDGGSGGDGGGGSESIQHEAAYEGNIGIMEVNKFFQIATPEQKKLFKQLLAVDRTKDAWRLVQDVTNVKLKGKEFAEGSDRAEAQADYMEGKCMVLAIAINQHNPTRYPIGYIWEYNMSAGAPDMQMDDDEWNDLSPEEQEEISNDISRHSIVHAYVRDQETNEYIDARGRHKTLPNLWGRMGQTRFEEFPGSARELIDITAHGDWDEVGDQVSFKRGRPAFDSLAGPAGVKRALDYAVKYLGVVGPELAKSPNVPQNQQGVAEGWDDEDEIDKITLIKSLQWPELVNKVSSAMKAMGWKGQRKDDGSFMFSTRGQLDDEWYIVIIDNRGNNMFTYALGTVEEGDPHIGEQESLPMTEASVSELMNAIREGFGLNEQGLAENFADGRNPQDKGDAKRHGVPTKSSVSTLRKVAKQGGRKGQLAHWMANMKAGKDKK